MPKDYYNILGVSQNAKAEEIKRAYKELAKKYHPDLHKGDKEKEEKFKEINEAYRVLSDDRARANYDRFGSAESTGGFQAGDFGFDFRGFDFPDFEDILGDFFGSSFGGGFGREGSRARARVQRGADLLHEIAITLEEAASGTAKSFILEKTEQCTSCNGTGAESGNMKTCDACNGSGSIKSSRRTPFGIFSTSTTCRKCNGTGRIAERICKACDGRGFIRMRKKIDVEIPAGIESGSKLRIAGEGEAGLRGGRSGDLYITVNIKPHEIFERRGADLYCEVSIPFSTAVLGGEIEAPTLERTAMIKIPPSTQTETSFRLRGKGMPRMHGYGSGDEYVKVKIKVPKKLSRKQRELIEELREHEREEE